MQRLGVSQASSLGEARPGTMGWMSDLLPAVEIEPRQPASAAVIWLHGLGADGHDFEPIVPLLGLDPELVLTGDDLPKETEIRMEILRGGATAWNGVTTLAQLKRKPASLVEFLFRECSFPAGCYLSTGTGIVPPDSFTLARGDEVRITIPPVGTLSNRVA